jgi:lipopolysaccharide/colanic/teichoic acid biosynthesis glycosyltransferase
MRLSNIIRPFNRRRALPKELRELRSVAELRTILDREKARADRSRVGFAMLKFVPRDEASAQEVLVRLAKILKRRLRTTDETGWLGDRQVGVVLFGTSVSGARSVANDIRGSFGDLSPPQCEVYYYPSDSISPPDGRRNGTAGHAKSDAPARALEALFVQPMTLAKRLLDMVGAVMALILFAPLMLGAAVAVRLTSPGPIVFKQLRAGRGGEPFWVYKFRTMQVDADRIKKQLLDRNELDGPAFKIKDDPRLTSIGRFLRRSSIDELPQLWNVLKGDMSLVGPRPLPCDESAACSAWQKDRLYVTPGLTCIWQVKGRSLVTFDEWMRMDLNYVHTRSFINDLKILAATVPAVVFRRGAY